MKSLLAVLLLSGIACSAKAADLGGVILSGDVAVVSDYRFRGYSLSHKGPALQASFTASAASGLYANLWASTIQEYGIDRDNDGAKVEIDTTVGYATELYGYSIDVAASRYNYPDARDVSYWEFPVSVSRVIGPINLTAGGAYAPSQNATGDKDNVYVYGRTDLELPTAHPITLSVGLGHEDGAFADAKVDWTIAAASAFGPYNVGLAYVDADAPGANATVVASIGWSF